MFSENFMFFKRVGPVSYLPATALNLREISQGLILSRIKKAK